MIRFRDPDGDDDPSPAGDPFADAHADDAGDEVDDALDHGARAGIDDTYTATCPYCGEECELFVDLGGGARQSYVEDCPVCCRPWQVRVSIDAEGAVTLELEPQDE